jgi:tetratricopeptide (TPR) repeat protein
MKRWTLALLALLLFAPAAAQAQKRPSNNMHTRSADVYLGQAQQARAATEKAELYGKALAAALEGARVDAGNPKPWFQAGVAHFHLDDFVAADSMFSRALQIYPDYDEEIQPLRLNAWIALYNRGVQTLQQGDVAAAITALEQANQIYSRRPEAMVTLGSLYAEAGDFAKAETTYRRALEVVRGPGRANLKPAELQAWQEDELGVSLRLANMLIDQDRAADAEKVYRDLLQSQPDNLMARANLAVVLSRTGQVDAASAIYRELLARDDLGENTLFNIGVGLFRAEKYGESAEAFRRATTVNPQSHEALYNLSQALLALTAASQGTPDAKRLNEELLETTARLHRIDPTNRTVFMMKAQAERSLGDIAGAGAADEWNRKVLATLEQHKALPFEVMDIAVTPVGDDVQVGGRVLNLTAAQDSPLRFRFSIIDAAGNELAGEDVSVNAPATTESARFNFRIPAPQGAAGWKYQVRQ